MAFGGALVMATASSCGGAQPTAETAPPPAPAPSGSVAGGPAQTLWKDMNHEQRLGYMKTKVFPQMKDEFTAVDAQRYADMNCGTCHGAGAKDGSFKMPNPDLPKLSVEGQFKKHRDKTPKMLDFMLQRVEPDMAKLFSEPPYDPQTHQGFGCFRCHTMEGGGGKGPAAPDSSAPSPEGGPCGDDVAVRKKCAPGLVCGPPPPGSPISEHTPGVCKKP